MANFTPPPPSQGRGGRCKGVSGCPVIQTKSVSYGTTVPEIIDPVFAKTSQNARFLLSENERFGLVFVKTGSINSGTGICFTISKRNKL